MTELSRRQAQVDPEREAPPSRSPLFSRALAAVELGDMESAQQLVDAAEGQALTLAQVFRVYQTELEAQARQLVDSQQRTEQALDWFANLFRTLPVAAILVDMQGLIVDANAHAMDELGLRRFLRVLPVPVRRLMAHLDGELRLSRVLPKLAAGETAALDDVALRTLDGQLRWADIRVTQVPPRAGEHTSPLALCVFNDRTAHIEAQRARDATAAAERQRDLAESASQAKTQLLSRVSHELRTPLNAVIGFSQLLLFEGDKLDPASRGKVQHIRDAGKHLLELVDEVLQINRAESGQLQVQAQPVPLLNAVQEVLALQEPMVRSMALTVQCTVDEACDGPPVALADPRRLREVLTNLVANAIKYNRSGGQLRVVVSADSAWARVEVSDTGIGMSTDQMSHLFEPFNRLGAERLPIAGHGLGLSIARTLTQAMRGTLSVESSPGQGSCFKMQLPRARQPGSAGA